MNQAAGLPASVQDLLRERVTSLEQLEAILLLRESSPRRFSVPEIAVAVRMPEALVAPALQSLAAAGVVTAAGEPGSQAYAYREGSEALDRAIAILASAYAESPSLIMGLMSRNAIERVRSGASRAFAEAFIFKNRNKDG